MKINFTKFFKDFFVHANAMSSGNLSLIPLFRWYFRSFWCVATFSWRFFSYACFMWIYLCLPPCFGVLGFYDSSHLNSHQPTSEILFFCSFSHQLQVCCFNMGHNNSAAQWSVAELRKEMVFHFSICVCNAPVSANISTNQRVLLTLFWKGNAENLPDQGV